MRPWLMLGGLSTFLLWTAHRSGTGDFVGYYTACRKFLLHLNPYENSSYPDNFLFGFPYPPIAILLTLGPSVFSLQTAVFLWDLACLGFYAGSVFIWMRQITGRSPSLSGWAHLSVAGALAPVIWSFWAHQMLVPTLFFAILAFQCIHDDRSFASGCAAGMMLLKPHLMYLAYFYLLWRTRRRRAFLMGTATVWLASASPFFLGYRPLSDLQGLYQSVKDVGTEAYYTDEQSVSALLYQWLWVRSREANLLTPRSASGIVNDPTSMRRLWRVKLAGVGASWLAFACLMRYRLRRRLSDPMALSWILVASLLLSPYSHTSDGVLLIPLMLTTLIRLSARTPLHNKALPIFFGHFLIAVLLPQTMTRVASWQRLSFASVGYTLLCAATLVLLKVRSQPAVPDSQ